VESNFTILPWTVGPCLDWALCERFWQRHAALILWWACSTIWQLQDSIKKTTIFSTNHWLFIIHQSQSYDIIIHPTNMISLNYSSAIFVNQMDTFSELLELEYLQKVAVSSGTHRGHMAWRPPSIGMEAPVMYEAASDARCTIVWVTSLTSPGRPRAWVNEQRWRNCNRNHDKRNWNNIMETYFLICLFIHSTPFMNFSQDHTRAWKQTINSQIF
jgi:hypothetical protein